MEAILGFQGPYPEGMHVIYAHEDLLGGLLTGLLKRCPDLLAGPEAAKRPAPPYLLIAAAIDADEPRFADFILASLKDRSISMKLAVVDGIARRAFLRRPAVKAQLLKLMAMKSIARNQYVLERFQRALDSFNDGPSLSGG